jgi:hypothetical protein
MESIISHRIVNSDISDSYKRDLGRNKYNFQKLNDSGDILIFREIKLPCEIKDEGLDSLTNEVRKSFNYLNELEIEGMSAHGLIRIGARGRLEDEKPKGYILEMTDEGPILYNLALLNEIPILAGYGSLLDPEQLAANTASGDLRNIKDDEIRKQLAEEKDVLNKMSYGVAKNHELIFNRAPTAKRHGNTQEERNNWAVLNLQKKEGKKAYIMLFDPGELTKDPLHYLARENFDELGYGRRRINKSDINILYGKKIKSDYVWILDSPLITDTIDEHQKLGTINSIIINPRTQIKENYINMITNGLVGANKISQDFVNQYIANTIQPDGKSLIENQRFMKTLERKLNNS